MPRLEKLNYSALTLATHNIASLYEVFPAPEAHRLARRLEIYHTPGNGSWLNVAEIELSVLAQQCLDRRIPCVEKLSAELTAWQQERNRKVDLPFRMESLRGLENQLRRVESTKG
ncbi:hypothetical protein H6G86_36135 [Nostoc sp. FACHB-133]|nr:hypothetical protein [Nostoc sp. FACHB-133]